MSVIYRDQNNQIILMCKGADNVIADRLSSANKTTEMYARNVTFVDQTADEGLRTLFLSEKYLTEQEFNEWYAKKCAALNEISDRDKKVAEVDEEIEKDMIIVGTSAIEDKL